MASLGAKMTYFPVWSEILLNLCHLWKWQWFGSGCEVWEVRKQGWQPSQVPHMLHIRPVAAVMTDSHHTSPSRPIITAGSHPRVIIDTLHTSPTLSGHAQWVLTCVIIGKPIMKKQIQQPRVNTGLCVRRYLGNSSEMEVTMVSMVANWNSTRTKAFEFNCPPQKPPSKVLCGVTRESCAWVQSDF